MQMAMFTKENGRMIRLTDKESILMLMVQDTKDNGLRINNMAMVLKDGQMVPLMKVNIHKERSMEKENSPGLTLVHSLAISLTTIFMEVVSMNGQMEEFILVIGKITRWKVMEPSLGQMAENMLDNMWMI